MPDSVRDNFRRVAVQVNGLAPAKQEEPFALRPASLKPGRAIPPREWLYGVQMIRRYVTVLVAPGGVGKTAWSVAAGAAIASGRAILGEAAHARLILSAGVASEAAARLRNFRRLTVILRHWKGCIVPTEAEQISR